MSDYHKRYYQANKEKLLAAGRARYKANREVILAGERMLRNADPEKYRKRSTDSGRRWRAKNRDRHLDSHRRRYWRSTGRPEPLRVEPLCCECCGRPRIGKALCSDHDAKTGIWRGWICGNCNRGIGLLGDDIASLQRAINYLTAASTFNKVLE